MAIKSLKEKATSGMLWSAIDRVIINIGQLAIAITLARLLTPEDFGLVAMLFVFLAISGVLVNSGMGSALIQSQNITKIDYSTVFVFNLIVSCILYILLFIAAPTISEFYNAPQLINLTRILGLSLIVNALSVTQRAHLQKKMDIKSLAKVNIVAFFISATVSILAALTGFGVWSLVLQTLVNSSLVALGLHFLSSQKISFTFSKKSFDSLFGYSSKILLSGLYAQSLQQVTSLAIGKFYLVSQLGFYTQAKTLADSSAGTLSSILQTVTFPLLASLQHDKDKMVAVYRRTIKMTVFITLPIMLLIATMAEPIILVLLGVKWLAAATLLKWLAIANALRPISMINMTILNAIGRSDLFLKVDLAKFPIIFIALIITIPISVKAITIGVFVTSFLSFFVETIMPGRLYGYGAYNQLKDMIKVIISTIIMVIILYAFLQIDMPPILHIIFGLPIAFFIFVFSAYVLKIDELRYFLLFFRQYFLKNQKL